MFFLHADDFTHWRAQAREALQKGLTPLDVSWGEANQSSLFETILPQLAAPRNVSAPKAFFDLAQTVACHRSPQRWNLLYQLLFRLNYGEKNLLHISTDPLMHALLRMEKAVRRDAHKAKAFVRFRKTEKEGGDHYIAWHRPDHYILPLVAPFFSRRFAAMQWTVMTPDQSVHWDGKTLTYGPGMPQDAAPADDVLEDLWRDYYRATFNPARIKLKMMKSEMPVRHWHTLPETKIIAEMLAEAPGRIEKMLKHTEGSLISATNFLPEKTDVESLRAAARSCEGCELYKPATQTVFGEGRPDAPLMLVGEQPGDEEDKTGHPFIGPAGQLLSDALARAGLTRDEVYITNAVKHFRFLYKDSYRHHRSPSRYHVEACKPWLHAEIAAIKPRAILCLGNTAARSLINPNFTMKYGRGQWLQHDPLVAATYHPSSILRAQGEQAAAQKQALIDDLLMAASALAA